MTMYYVTSSAPYMWVDEQSGGYASMILTLVIVLLLVVFYRQVITALGEPRMRYLKWKHDRVVTNANYNTPEGKKAADDVMRKAGYGIMYIENTRVLLKEKPANFSLIKHSLAAALGFYSNPAPEPAPVAVAAPAPAPTA